MHNGASRKLTSVADTAKNVAIRVLVMSFAEAVTQWIISSIDAILYEEDDDDEC